MVSSSPLHGWPRIFALHFCLLCVVLNSMFPFRSRKLRALIMNHYAATSEVRRDRAKQANKSVPR